jgi:putative DNA methylase
MDPALTPHPPSNIHHPPAPATPATKRAIEEGFPIVAINHLALPERNSFKPIYQMHKWFARRASCVFRAIILAALKPPGTDIMAEFYKDHTNDPDTKGKVVLDPFMGGGTTVVEALRLGCEVLANDLNPVAWFIVKTEVEAAGDDELHKAFDRLASRKVPWSGKPLRQTLLDLYRTAPPWTSENLCGLPQSDIIYNFWVKSALCINPNCRKQVPLFSDYIVATKNPSIRYYPDCTCPHCKKTFDWELDPAALVADPRLLLHSSTYSAGAGRSTTRWTYAHEDGGIYLCQGAAQGSQCAVKTGTLEAGHAYCPHCSQPVKPHLASKKKKRKKVALTVLLCPRTEDIFQWRGDLPEDATVTSPAGHTFAPLKGNLPDKGHFLCPHCGNNDAVIESIRSLPEDKLLPVHPYCLYAYSPACDPANAPEKRALQDPDLFESTAQTDDTEDQEIPTPSLAYDGPYVPPDQNIIWKQSGKFYTRYAPADQARYSEVEAIWEEHKNSLPHPQTEIPHGQETGRLHDHHYHYWRDMFNSRQLLALSTLLAGIKSEPDERLRRLLLCPFSTSLEPNNLFTRLALRNTPGGTPAAGIFARHDYQPKLDPLEQNVWGTISGRGTFINNFAKLLVGKRFNRLPYDRAIEDDHQINKPSSEKIDGTHAQLHCQDSREFNPAPADLIITDPPYAGNVNYAELADFFYVWLRLALPEDFFLPEYCPKLTEIVENKARGLTYDEFTTGLTQVFSRASAALQPHGLMVFTFHHAEGSAWESVLKAICDSGFALEAVYPSHSEAENTLHLMDNEAIAYDLIHVCRKRRPEDTRTKRSWAGLRQLVRQRAREEIVRIETGRYGGEPLPPPDIRMVLIGKCLEVYSRHYGAVLDWNGEPFPLKAALQDIRMMVEQIVSRETPLPSELENADPISQVWLLALCDRREVSVDTISKLTRGIFEVSDLTDHNPPLLRKGRVKGGRTYEVLTPVERLDALQQHLKGAGSTAEQLPLLDPTDNKPIAIGPALVDVLHLLAANAEQGERLDHLVERFRGQREPLRAALQYLQQRDPDRWNKPAEKLLPFYTDMYATPPSTRQPSTP